MKRFTGHNEPWGDFIDVKINAPDLIPEKSEKYKNKNIFISSVTDPYLFLEKKYEITRKILEKLIYLKPNLSIQTKSNLILRDIDLLKKFENCEVGLTITSLDEKISKEIEPFASLPEQRIETLQKLKNENLKTYVFVGPIIPFITDWKNIILKTKDFTDFYMFENLNISGGNWNSIKNWIEKYHSNLFNKFQEIYFTENNYWNNLEKEIEYFCEEKNIDYKNYFHHDKSKK